jgi:hypothetical protein
MKKVVGVAQGRPNVRDGVANPVPLKSEGKQRILFHLYLLKFMGKMIIKTAVFLMPLPRCGYGFDYATNSRASII